MTKLKAFLIFSGYQFTWMMCIFGELLYNSYFHGIIFGSIFLIICFFNSNNKFKFTIIILSISIPGYLFDTILVFLKIYNFETSSYFGLLPVWLLILWPSFAVLFDEVFVFLSNYKFIGILFSGVLGPLTYYLGSPLGLIIINHFLLFIVLMIFFWISLMLFYLNYLLKIKFN